MEPNEMKLTDTFLLRLAFFPEIQERKKVFESSGIVFEIRTKEQGHNIPHCHAFANGKNISISLVDYSILAGNLSKRQETFAVDFVKQNIEVLKSNWNSFHSFTI